MDTGRPQLTPGQAREQLVTVRTRPLSSTRDRTVHAVGMVFVGVVLGAHMASRNLVGEGTYALWGVVLVGLLLMEMIWVDRAARTVPRGVRLWSWAGFIASFIVGRWVVTPWLNVAAQTAPNTWPMVVGGAAATAAPSLLAAAIIDAGRK